jgi:poly-gamma-glutamate capsule biosynthesis protein CapA/YwtB (metallophosphatase superfamily)
MIAPNFHSISRTSLSRKVIIGLVLLMVSIFAGCSAQLGGAEVALITPQPAPATSTPGMVVDPPSSPAPTLTPTLTTTPEPTVTQTPTQTPLPEIRLLFTGIIVPGRCVEAGMAARGDADYIYDNVRDLIQGADLAVGTLNGTISEFSPKTGCVVTFVLVGSPLHADAMAVAGFDAVSAATNHIKNCNLSNCGDRAFLETLENLARVGIVPIGAGLNHADAMQPQVFDVKGVRFGIVSLGEIEPLAFAGEDTPGIAILNEQNLREAIAEARRLSDVVIAMPHWGPEYSPHPNWNQRTYAQIAVEAGADLVVGNHTHVVQAIQTIDEVPVFYGLGNFVFDQTWSVETRQSVILVVTFRGMAYQSYELIPVVTDMDGRVHLAGDTEAAEILARIAEASWRLP